MAAPLRLVPFYRQIAAWDKCDPCIPESGKKQDYFKKLGRRGGLLKASSQASSGTQAIVVSMSKSEKNRRLNQAIRSSRGHADLIREEKIPYGKRGNGRFTKPDHSRIVAMAIAGCPSRITIKRLGCSESTVKRALRAKGIMAGTNRLVGTNDEWMLWASARRLGASFDQIGYRFGLSGEHIRKNLKRLRKA